MFTVNNYSDDDEEFIAAFAATDSVKYLIYGRETAPETGTPHLQGYVSLTKRREFNFIKAQLPQGTHIERAKGSAKQNQAYCSKGGDSTEFGDVPAQGKRSDFDRFFASIDDGDRDPKRLRRDHPGIMAKYPTFARQVLADVRPPPACPDINLRFWQRQLLSVLSGPAHARRVYVFVDLLGGRGKSTFARFIASKFAGVQVMAPARFIDMAYELQETTKILILDCPRSRESNIRWDFLEAVKDGRVFSTKYEPITKYLDGCHVIVFTNFQPDQDQLSADRWDITNLDAEESESQDCDLNMCDDE